MIAQGEGVLAQAPSMVCIGIVESLLFDCVQKLIKRPQEQNVRPMPSSTGIPNGSQAGTY